MKTENIVRIEDEIEFKKGEKISIRIELCNISPLHKQTIETYLDVLYEELKLSI